MMGFHYDGIPILNNTNRGARGGGSGYRLARGIILQLFTQNPKCAIRMDMNGPIPSPQGDD